MEVQRVGLGPSTVAVSGRSATDTESALAWLSMRDATERMSVTRVSLDHLARWSTDPQTGAIHHDSGRFFSIEGINVTSAYPAVPTWSQPIIRQPETGILGILVTVVDGQFQLLLQAKIEPGNPHGHEISPTVQATRSNYTKVHQGKEVPYLEHFLEPEPGRVLVDVRQSEQGSWFLGKRNRNVVVQTDEPPEAIDGFRWFSMEEIDRLLAIDNVVNMDTRTVLACLPRADTSEAGGSAEPLMGFSDVLSVITRARSRLDTATVPASLATLPGWHRTAEAISHETGAFFEIVGVDVESEGREVSHWSQPMLTACGIGIAALLVTRIDGVLHALLQLRNEPGFVDTVELGPTVQCIPHNYSHLPPLARPALLDFALAAPRSSVLFDTLLSEEGGRFLDTETRYMIVETPEAIDYPGFLWLTVPQLESLVQHSHYLNVQARSLVACMRSLASTNSWKTS